MLSWPDPIEKNILDRGLLLGIGKMAFHRMQACFLAVDALDGHFKGELERNFYFSFTLPLPAGFLIER
jgi:hypothetical protein